MCGAAGAPTMDPWFPQFHDIVATCRHLARHTLRLQRDEMIGKAFYCCDARVRSCALKVKGDTLAHLAQQ
jgi:hypothetical protein